MPLMFLHYRSGTFEADALDALVDKITHVGEELEKLDMTPFVLSTTWVYCSEYAAGRVYHGGKPGGSAVVSVLINVIRGGYSARTKAQLIAQVTDAVAEHAKMPRDEPRRVYVVIREVEESNWGFDGRLIDLEDLRAAPEPEARPL